MQRLGKTHLIIFTGFLLGGWLWTAPPAEAACRSNIEATTPTTDFTLDDSLGIATHRPTGLTWMRCALGQNWDGANKTCTGSPGSYTWGEALRAAKDYAFAGYSDWRLPNIKELQTLAEDNCATPSINETVFPGTASDLYRSSSAYADYPDSAWGVYFGDGVVYTNSRAHGSHVRLARGGQSFGDYPDSTTSRAINITISQSSPGRYRLLGTLVDANNQTACGLVLASGRCVFTCGPGSPRCEGGTDSLPFGQFDLTDLPTETNGAINLQTFVAGSAPGFQVVKPDGSVQLVSGTVSQANSHTLNTTINEVSPGRYRLLGTLLDAKNQPACGLVLASGRCMFSCGSGSPRCEGGISNLAFGQFDLTDLPTETNGAINLQTFVAGSMPGFEVVKPPANGCSYAIDPTSKTFGYQGDTGTVNVITQSGCAWTAQSNDSWIAITSGASGAGPGEVGYSVSVNSSRALRTGTVTIAGKILTISQNTSGGEN